MIGGAKSKPLALVHGVEHHVELAVLVPVASQWLDYQALFFGGASPVWGTRGSRMAAASEFQVGHRACGLIA